MNRLSWVVLVISILTLVGVGLLLYDSKIAQKAMPSFRDDEAKYATDLVGKSVTLPQGQLWGFNWDQQISVSQVAKRALDESTVLVVVELKAVAKLAPPQPSKDKDKDRDKEPKIATLGGYAKLLYEKINSQWYLVNIDGVSLKVVAE